MQGKYYYQVVTYYPSSKICSPCGHKTNKMNDLSIRNWESEVFGSKNERNLNTSMNIIFEGLKLHYQS